MKEYCTQIEITKDLRIDLFTDRGFRIRTFKNGRPDDPELYEIPFAVGHIDPWGPVAYEIRKEKKTVYIKTAVLTIIVNTETGIWTVETKEKQLYPSDKPVYGLICNGCMIFDSAAGIFERNKNSRYTHWFYNETSQQYDRYLGEDKIFDVYFLYGETYAALYREFNNLTGPVPMLPKPMFGFMQTQHLLKEGNQEKFLQLAKVMRAKQIPCDTLILDLEWGDGFDDDGNLVQWGSRMDWSGKYKRPFSPEEMIRQLKEMHYHLMMDFHSIPDIEHRDEVPIAVPANYIGVPHPVEEWKKNMKKLLDSGVDGPWQDQRHADFVEGYIWKAISQHKESERVWFLQCNEMFDTESWDQHHKPIPNTKLMGSHRYPIAWTGDVDYTWHELEYQIKAIINIHGPLKGISYISADAFAKNAKVQARWHQFLCFSPLIKNHTQKPWETEAFANLDLFAFQTKEEESPKENKVQKAGNKTSEDVIRKFIEERYQLLPYLYTYAYQHSNTGMPICRPLMIAFPEDTMCGQNQWPMEYMFGNEILAAPVYNDGLTKEIYLPAKNRWIDYWDGTVYETGEIGTVLDYPVDDIEKMPLFIRGGSILPRQEPCQWIDPKKTLEVLYLDVYPAEYSEFELYEDDGLTWEYKEGKYVFTRFCCQSEKSRIRFTIERAKGFFEGFPKERTYRITIHMIGRPERILFDGKPMDFTEKKKEIFFELQAKTDRECTVVLEKITG